MNDVNSGSGNEAVSTKQGPVPSGVVRWLLRALALVALVAAGYLSWASSSDGAVVCGSGALDCEAVLQSRWSHWFNVPVSVPAVSLYATMLMAMAFIGPAAAPRLRRAAWGLLTVLMVVAGGAAIWFIGLQVAMRGFCVYCLTAHACSLAIAAIILLRIRPFQLRPTLGLATVGLALVGLLVVGQLRAKTYTIVKTPVVDGASGVLTVGSVEQPRQGEEETTDRASDPPIVSASDAPEAKTPDEEPDDGADRHRIITVLGGLRMDVGTAPLLGSLEAKHVLVELYDYTCSVCRRSDRNLAAARDYFGDHQIAVALLPIPMNVDCNRYIQRTPKGHETACELTRLALAVARTDQNVFPHYHNWLFEPAKPRSVEEAKAYAAELIGSDVLEEALADKGIDEQIQVNLKLWGRYLDAAGVPLVILPAQTLKGTSNTTGEMIKLLGDKLGLEKDST